MDKGQFDNKLGETVKSVRQVRSLTQSHLAERLEITTRYLKYIESGGRRPSLNLLERIIDELDIPSDQVLPPKHEPLQREIYIMQGGKTPG